ncbi:MAG: hypothetical protein ACKVUS_04725 [Saprospiraceae bacterium]
MLRTFLALSLLAWVSATAFCQVPGYLGKRLTVQGELHSFPAMRGPTASNRGYSVHYGDKGGGFGFNWSAGARLGYVTSRYGQVLLSVDYLKTGMIQTAFSPASGFLGEEGYDSHELFYNVRGLTAGIGTRKFKSAKGGLAPMGRYSGYSLNATFLKGEILDKRTSYRFGGPEHAPLGIDPKHVLLSLGYEFGSNFIVKDRLLLNVGAKLNIPLSPRAFRHTFSEEESLWDPYYNNQEGKEDGNTDNFKTLAATRYGLHSLFMFYIGVGLLP